MSGRESFSAFRRNIRFVLIFLLHSQRLEGFSFEAALSAKYRQLLKEYLSRTKFSPVGVKPGSESAALLQRTFQPTRIHSSFKTCSDLLSPQKAARVILPAPSAIVMSVLYVSTTYVVTRNSLESTECVSCIFSHILFCNMKGYIRKHTSGTM